MSKINWNKISKSIYDNFDKIEHIFKLGFTPDNQGWVGKCPFHSGAENTTAFRIFPTATAWCFSGGCMDNKCSLVHFLKMLLEQQSEQEYHFDYVLKWYTKHILEGDLSSIPDYIVQKVKQEHIPTIFYNSLYSWEKFAECPSETYIRLGFSREIVNQYNIGECHDRNHRMYNRIVVPQFNIHGQIVGYTGRSMYKQCSRCKLYHYHLAPCPVDYKNGYNKWIHVKGFKTSHYLYNDWNIPETEEVILVESIGNTLKMLMAGAYNTCGLFGNRLSEGQVDILEQMGVKHITWIADNDAVHQAGLKGAQTASRKFRQFRFKLLCPPVKYNDVGEMNVIELNEFLRLKKVNL